MQGRAAVAALFALLSSPLAAQDVARSAPEDAVRQEIVITNQNLALVTESRRVTIPAGSFELFWDGVPASARTETWTVIRPREAGVRWLGLTSLLPGQAAERSEWLESLVGKRVRIARPGGGSSEGEVLSVHGPTPDLVLFREGSELVYGEPQARLSLPAGPERASRPAGVYLRLAAERAGARELTSRYLVGDLTWEANYALTLAADEKTGRLEGWFTVENRAATEFSPARLRLLAGVLRTAAPPYRPMAAERAGIAAMSVAQSVAASESRIYEVPTPGRLATGRTTFPLAEDVNVAVEKRYLVRSTYWMGQNEEPHRLPVAVQYRVETKPLDRALPAGVVRVYAEGGTLFSGEDRIEHTPEKTDIEVETSEAFDLTARRRQTSFQQLSRFESESTYEVALASRKKEPVAVVVRENFPGDWQIVESSASPKKVNARTADFAVTVPPGGEAKLTYRVRVKMGS